MRPTTTVACLAALLAMNSRVLGQAGDGYVGVFGDAAGTIRCMHAAPGVPTTLYVVGKASGATGNGISGAEFRIQIQNSSGYYISYTAPGNVQMVGAPLDSTGCNVTWSTCQVPAANGTIAFGTIFVFNMGSGGQTNIIVKRKNPPSNATFPYALFTLCDDPAFSKSRMTFPPDSVSCLTQKVSPRSSTGGDEFATSLEGTQIASEYREYEGYTFAPRNAVGYRGARCRIGSKNPVVGSTIVAAWVGITNGDPKDDHYLWRWLQGGWLKYSGWPSAKMYYEANKPGYHEVQLYGAPVADELYAAEMVDDGGTLMAEITVNGIVEFSDLWATWFGTQVFRGAQFGVEGGAGGDVDQTPGTGTGLNTPTAPCLFFSAYLWRVGVSTQWGLVDFADLPDECEPLHRAAHSNKRPGTLADPLDSLGKFITWYFP